MSRWRRSLARSLGRPRGGWKGRTRWPAATLLWLKREARARPPSAEFKHCVRISPARMRACSMAQGGGAISVVVFGVFLVTPPGSVLCRFERSSQIRIITILGRPPSITCTSEHTRYAGGIVITLQQFSMDPTKEHIYNNDSPSQEKKRLQYKEPKNSGSEIVSDYGQDTNWTKSPEDKRRHHISAQAKTEGFPC